MVERAPAAFRAARSRGNSGMIPGRMIAWWYLCIGAGFVALGVRAFLAGAGRWGVILRCLIALGFLTLGAMSLRRKSG